MSLSGKYFALKQAACRFAQGCTAYPFAKLRGNGISTYWGFRNFGDLITPLLLRKIGYTPVNSARVSFGDFVFVGSILDSIRDDYSGIILGSGFLNDRRPKKLICAKILGVRGVHTKRLLGIDYDVPLGDGGLILPCFLQDRPASKYAIGIVPHYADAHDERVRKWKTLFGDNVHVVNVLQEPEAVFNEICSCEHIISSSLHGLVVADSLGIPNRWMVMSDLYGNREFKFHDYYSAFGESRIPYIPRGDESLSFLISNTTKPSSSVQERIEEIYHLFMSLPKYFPCKRLFR